MKKMNFRYRASVWLLAILCILCPLRLADAEGFDSEAALRQKLLDASGARDILTFGYADYDGNGEHEAFGIVGESEGDEYMQVGALWFVHWSGAVQCETEGGCYPSECGVVWQDGRGFFSLSEGYGGSGSQTRLWSVDGGQPYLSAGGYMTAENLVGYYAPEDVASAANSNVEGLQKGEGNAWYAFPSYFDACTDGTGHTWKRYFYYMDDHGGLHEYGGIYITMNEFLTLEGAAQVVQTVEGEGYSILELIYRGNGIINLNLRRGDNNANICLLSEGSKVTMLDLMLNPANSLMDALEGGYYLAAHTPELAEYPFAFVPGSASPTPAPEAEQGPALSVETQLRHKLAETTGSDYFLAFQCGDYDGNGTQEAYALVLTGLNDGYMAEADLWFVSSAQTVLCESGFGYYYTDSALLGNPGALQFLVVEGYGGSGFEKRLWSVINGNPHLDTGSFMVDGYVLPGASTSPSLSEGNFPEEPYMTVVNCAEYVTLRSAPSTSAAAIAKVPLGAEVIFKEEVPASSGGERFCKVIYGSQEGYILAKYLAFSSGGSLNPGASVSIVRIAGGKANVRTGPGLAYESMGTLKENQTAAYLGQSSTDNRGVAWYKIQFGGREGWVSSKYARIEQTSSGAGSISSGIVRIVDGKANVRTGPGLAYESMGTLKENQTAAYLGKTSTDNRGVAWYKIQFGGREGWVSSKYARIEQTSSGAGSISSGTVRIVDGKTNVRTGPGLTYESMGTLKEGRTAAYLGKTSTDNRGVAWYKIQFGGREGWVSSKYARIE